MDDTATVSLLDEATALRQWGRAVQKNPYDRTARERYAAVLLRIHGEDHPLGTIERGRALLGIIRASFPTPALHAAYFANLERLLAGKRPLTKPGRLVVALGPGRCGSTSLTAILASVPGACCTHENPPLIHWPPCEEQVQFHLLRFTYLRRFFPLVFDAAHWWLTVADRLCAQFPDILLLGLWRDPGQCAKSFLAVKGPYNHWAEPGAGWPPNPWDPAYPSYSTEAPEGDREAERRRQVQRYVANYYEGLGAVRSCAPGNFLDVPTQKLSNSRLQAGLFAQLGLEGQIRAVRLNVGVTTDGIEAKYCF